MRHPAQPDIILAQTQEMVEEKCKVKVVQKESTVERVAIDQPQELEQEQQHVRETNKYSQLCGNVSRYKTPIRTVRRLTRYTTNTNK